ncbi:LacI family DNA-binding transcriptional regulator [Deinococcus roseus]|uniref:LacI family transcriptional regulator n=1 Tax=Deinococcus roseus TaxID=392414 RepID=A0ABQ2DGJ4_9DEIO|nr:LacI family DNA-binding transcriptional regulator [Deinococcus roseus]GGJ56996.1 LacI family transcriptional regulator [Deinococcus roseus]
MAQFITVKDVAREAGVSTATISRVLNNTGPVAQETRERIEAAIEKLNYQPNVVAQELVRGRSSVIGILTQHSTAPFYGDILNGITDGLQNTTYQPLFAHGFWSTEKERAALQVLISRRVDALIVVSGDVPDEDLIRLSEKLPLVVVAREVPGLEKRCLHVDNVRGGYLATRHLLDLGHRKIVHITGYQLSPHQFDARDRLQGYRQAMQEAGIEVQPEWVVEGNFTEESGVQAVDRLIQQEVQFTAVFAGNDQMAFGARLALHQHGLMVPEAVSVVGYDDLTVSRYAVPPLTTVRQPAHKMGVTAAKLTLSLLGKSRFVMPVFSNELVVRKSTRKLQR